MIKKLGAFVIALLMLSSILMVGVHAGDLELYKSEFNANNEEDDLTSGTDIQVHPSQRFSITTFVKNLLKKSSDTDFEEIEIELKIEELDIIKNKNFVLDNGDKKEFEFEILIPSKTNEGEYNAQLSISGIDSENNLHEDEINFIVEVEEYKHQVNILSTRLNNDVYVCNQPVKLNVNLDNVGKYDESNVKVKANLEGKVYTELMDINSGGFKSINLEIDPINFDSEIEVEVLDEFGDVFHAVTIPIDGKLCRNNPQVVTNSNSKLIQLNDLTIEQYKAELLKAQVENSKKITQTSQKNQALKVIIVIMMFCLIALCGIFVKVKFFE